MSHASIFDQAKACHLAGRLDEARTLYQSALADQSDDANTRFHLAILELQSGNAPSALEQIDQVLAQEGRGEVRHLRARGEILCGLGRLDEACTAYRDALNLTPDSADTAFSLGSALQALGEPREAAAAYVQALRHDPAHADAANNLGNCHQQCGDLERAEQAYRSALTLQPAHADALSNLGALLLARGTIEQALPLLQAAVEVAPASVSALINLGVALNQSRCFAAAAEALERACTLDPHDAQAAYNLGLTLEGLQQDQRAATQYQRATLCDPTHAEAFNNLGNVLRRLGNHEAALAAFNTALCLRPDLIAAYNNVAALLRAHGRFDEAETHLRTALARDPRHSVTHNNLATVLKDGGALDEAVASYQDALACDAGNPVARSNLAYALTFLHEDPAPALLEALRWSEHHETPLQGIGRPRRTTRQRPRIGYLSADFRDHCQALFLEPLLAHHDRSAFEIVCYANVAQPDAITARLAGHADLWRDIHALDDAAAARLIADDDLDILIDLTMHMAHHRAAVLARKPAPIQVAWLAYPGTTGLSAIDYRLTDARLDPPEHDAHYRERSIRLADSFWCYNPLADRLPETLVPSSAPLIERGYPTFGCLNNPCKLTDRTFSLWSGIFAALPEARLVLMAPEGRPRARLLERLSAHGITAERVRFVPFRARADYLATYGDIDMVLDTFPYNGHTTSLDALWMGVPVITRVGRTAVGRGGLSQLTHLGLTDLAADDDASFTRIALELACDLPRLERLRHTLRPHLEHSPLMDGPRFARAMETAYRDMLSTTD